MAPCSQQGAITFRRTTFARLTIMHLRQVVTGQLPPRHAERHLTGGERPHVISSADRGLTRWVDAGMSLVSEWSSVVRVGRGATTGYSVSA